MTRSVDAMIDFFLREKGEAILRNGLPETALIMDATEKIQYEDDKLIRTAVEIRTGDLIEYRYEKYLITSQIDKNENSYRGRMRKCSYSIAFNCNSIVKWLDAIVEGKTFSIETGNMMSLPMGLINVLLQENPDTREIKLSQRFMNTHQPFKVAGIDHSVNGIIKLSCTLDLITANDDIANNIANNGTAVLGQSGFW